MTRRHWPFSATCGVSASRYRFGHFLLMAVLLASFISLSASAFGQASTSLRGAVTDPTGGAIAGAQVLLLNPESKTKRTATTGEQGEYQFLFIPPGTYTLTVSAKGFQRSQISAVQLLVKTPATINLVHASIGNSFDENQVKQVPLEGRNVPDLLSLQPGVAYTGNRTDIDYDQDTRNGAVNGARSDQSNITLDGVDVNDQVAGYAFTSVLPTTLDSVQEFRVTTANYNADQGTGSGAQVSLMTKSGTNVFHGWLYESHRNTITSANDYVMKQSELASGTPNKPNKLLRNIFGVSVGGPLKKDRLFFFANYEGTRRREEQATVRSIPSPAMRDGVIQYECPVKPDGSLDTTTC